MEVRGMVRVAIVEDEPACAEILKNYIMRFQKENGTRFEVTEFRDGLDLAENYRPIWDLILMDVEMTHLDGMSTAGRIRQVDPAVLLMFVTNMAQYAIQGYQVDAIDYVLKPVSYAAFTLKLRKALRVLADRKGRQLLLSREGGAERVSSTDVFFVEVADHCVVYHTSVGQFTATGTLREVEQDLDGEPFVRCNSCYLVNLRHVSAIKQDFVRVGDQELKISRPRKKQFLQRLSDYYGGGGR